MEETLKKFTVVEEFELDGAVQAVGSVVELSEAQATELGSKVEAVAEEGAASDGAPTETGDATSTESAG